MDEQGRKFVILEHRRQDLPVHWDLMLEPCEPQAKLLTYSLLSPPAELLQNGKVRCKRIFDHDRKFLSYEGAVNKGKGNVVRIDEGQYFCDHGLVDIYHFRGRVLCGCYKFVGDGEDLFMVRVHD
jgi:hypothetical protein